MADFVLAAARWAFPFLLILEGIFAGIVFEHYVLKRVTRGKSRFRESFFKAFNRMGIVWFTLAGVYAAVRSADIIPGIVISARILGILNKTILVVFVLSLSLVIARICGGGVRLYTRKTKGLEQSTSIFVSFLNVLIFVIGLMVILQSFGVSITPLLTALGIGGIAIALALQDTLSNLFAGFQIIASKKIRVGDYIKLDSGDEGHVTDITWRNTTIRSLPNNTVVLPNSRLANSIVTNYNIPEKEMSFLVQVGVSYGSDLEKVERATVDVAREIMKTVPGGVPGFEPFIRYHTFGDFSIGFTVIMRAKEFVDHYPLKHEFVKKLHARYIKEGIEIPFPIRTVRMQGGDVS